MRGAVLCLVLLLAGCAAAPRAEGPSAGAGLRLAADGLRPNGSDLRIDFGRSKQGVVTAVTRVLGDAPDSDTVNAECGAGPVNIVTWDGLDLNFQNGALQGWVTRDSEFTTMGGLRVGQDRAALTAAGITAFQTTSLGTEFEGAGVFGLLESGDKVDLLWAGLTCFFR